jgi:NAD(P)H-dependent FMN reductase
MTETVKNASIGIIVGSNRPNRVSPSIAKWLNDAMQRDGLKLSIIDLAEINLPFLDEPGIPARGNYQNEHTKAWSKLIQSYDGFVLLFPQYNWGYPAVLKNALDYLYVEWGGKPVSIMPFGHHGGFQAMLAMNLVTKGLHMIDMATNIQIDIMEKMFDEQGQFKDIDVTLERYRGNAQLLASEFVDLLHQK